MLTPSRAWRVIFAITASLFALGGTYSAFLAYGEEMAVRTEATRHRAVARSWPIEEFTADRQNCVLGTVLSDDGSPCDGAIITVFDTGVILSQIADTALGGWPSVAAEREVVADAEGRFRADNLGYGSKFVVARANGHASMMTRDCLHIEGIATRVRISLRRMAMPVRIKLWDSGGPVTDANVRVLPPVWGLQPISLRTDNNGELHLPASATEFSQAVAMGGDNALSFTITVFAGALPSTNALFVQQSNDLENWSQVGIAAFNSQGVGSAMATSGYGSIASSYIRFKVTAGGSATVLSLTVNTAHL